MKKIALIALLLIPVSARGQEPKAQDEITPAAEKAIDKALDYLAKSQSKFGYLPGSVPVATTAMSGLAWMASGSTPMKGKYAENIRKALRYIRKMTTRSGYVMGPGSSGMYGHGYSTLFLAEALGMLKDKNEVEETRDALGRATRLLVKAQNRFGGWNSNPDGSGTDDGSGAIAIMQITALRASKNAGIQVDMNTIKKAKKYLGEMMTKDGWYSYNYHSKGRNRPSSASTGAGAYMYGVMDMYDTPKYEKAIKNIMNNAPFLKGGKRGSDSGWSGWWYYTAFYSSLAIFQHGGKEWTKWYPAIRDDIIKKQQRNGSWPDSYGGLYTAFAVLTLELPLRILPIFQEGGKGAEGK